MRTSAYRINSEHFESSQVHADEHNGALSGAGLGRDELVNQRGLRELADFDLKNIVGHAKLESELARLSGLLKTGRSSVDVGALHHRLQSGYVASFIPNQKTKLFELVMHLSEKDKNKDAILSEARTAAGGAQRHVGGVVHYINIGQDPRDRIAQKVLIETLNQAVQKGSSPEDAVKHINSNAAHWRHQIDLERQRLGFPPKTAVTQVPASQTLSSASAANAEQVASALGGLAPNVQSLLEANPGILAAIASALSTMPRSEKERLKNALQSAKTKEQLDKILGEFGIKPVTASTSSAGSRRR